MSTPPDDTTTEPPTDPDDLGPLGPPYGVAFVTAPTGAWDVTVRWEYDFRYAEIDHFIVRRRKQGESDWNIIATGLANTVRTYHDTLPDGSPYAYSVAAKPVDGSPELVSEPVLDPDGMPLYIHADTSTTAPQNIRKPLRSTKNKMFIAWDYHSGASSYLLEAVDEQGTAYYSTHVTDVYAPYGLLVGPHPTEMITVRVSVMRRNTDGSEYLGSFASEQFFVDNAKDPHFAVVDIAGQDSTALLTRSLAYSVVMALAERGTDKAQLTVNGVVYQDMWTEDDGHHSAVIETCFPAGSAVTAAMRVTAPDNLPDSAKD